MGLPGCIRSTEHITGVVRCLKRLISGAEVAGNVLATKRSQLRLELDTTVGENLAIAVKGHFRLNDWCISISHL